jgi:hypothetical protein
MERPLDIYQLMLSLDVQKVRNELKILEQQTDMKRRELNNKIKLLKEVKDVA